MAGIRKMQGRKGLNNLESLGRYVVIGICCGLFLLGAMASAMAAKKDASEVTRAPSAQVTEASEKPAATGDVKPEASTTASKQKAGASAEKPQAKKKRYYPQGSPTRAIQELDDMLEDFRVAPKGEELSAADRNHNAKLKQQIIHGTFDIRELSRQSLGKHWDERSAAERDRFVGLLTDLLEEKALFSKEQSAAKSKSGGKYFVLYRGHRFDNKAKTKSYVRTKVVVPAENIDITLNYRLKKQSKDWKIYDIIVDEASLVDNYRYQFDTIIKKHGFADLVGRMSKKLETIKKDRKS